MRTWRVVERVAYLVEARSPVEAQRKVDQGVAVKGSLRASVCERTVIERFVTEWVGDEAQERDRSLSRP